MICEGHKSGTEIVLSACNILVQSLIIAEYGTCVMCKPMSLFFEQVNNNNNRSINRLTKNQSDLILERTDGLILLE